MGMPEYDVEEIGFNYRLDDIRSALGLEQIKKLKTFNQKRERATNFYISLISKHLPEVIIPFKNKSYESSFHIFPILLPLGFNKRNDLIKKMQSFGIQCSIHYRPIHTFKVYLDQSVIAITNKIANKIVTLPLYPSISKEEITFVVNKLVKSLELLSH